MHANQHQCIPMMIPVGQGLRSRAATHRQSRQEGLGPAWRTGLTYGKEGPTAALHTVAYCIGEYRHIYQDTVYIKIYCRY